MYDVIFQHRDDNASRFPAIDYFLITTQPVVLYSLLSLIFRLWQIITTLFHEFMISPLLIVSGKL